MSGRKKVKTTLNVSTLEMSAQEKRLLEKKIREQVTLPTSVGFTPDSNWDSQRTTVFWDAYFTE